MIDTHCHLDRVPDIDLALDNTLAAMVTIGTDPDSSRVAVALAKAVDRVFAAVGLHPSSAGRLDEPGLRTAIETLARAPGVVAIGESGFDTYWDGDALPMQRRSFAWQVELARARDLPLVVHVRDADGREDASLCAIEMLREHAWTRGVLHCCNGHAALVETGLDLGWYVSFAGNVTYPRAAAIREAAVAVPEDRLLVETDAPFLAPVPHRGKRNLPAFVAFTAQTLATLRGVDPATLEAALDANARRCYALSS